MSIRTTDLGCAAALVAKGHEVKDVDGSNPRRVEFIFEGSEELEQDKTDYYADRLQIPSAIQMYNGLRALRERMYDVKQGR